MRIKNLLYAFIAAIVLIVSTPANATDSDNYFATGLTVSGSSNAGYANKTNGGVQLDGMFELGRFNVFGDFGMVQSAKNTIGETQILDLRGAITFNITEKLELGGGYRQTKLDFTEANTERTDTAPFAMLAYDFRREKRVVIEAHLPDSSQYETKALTAAFQKTFDNGLRLSLRYGINQFHYNAPVTQSSTASSTEGLVASTKSSDAPPGYERASMMSYSYKIGLAYRFDRN